MAAYPHFPRLSRRPALKTKTSYAIDPTLRDDMANGMETTRAKFTRARLQYAITFEAMTNADIAALRDFVENVAVFGANIFWFTDARDKKNPKQLMVRFANLPAWDDQDWISDQFRQRFTLTIREV